MARSSILLPAAILLLGVGCVRAPTLSDTVPETPAQAKAVEWAHCFADKLNVRLDAVLITTPPTPKYFGWALCNAHAIGFNIYEIDKPENLARIRWDTAHEVCHVHLKHNLPCGKAEPVQAELDADACALELFTFGGCL